MEVLITAGALPQAVVDALYARTDIDTSKIVVFGRSLGGAVSVYLAEKEPSRVRVAYSDLKPLYSIADSFMLSYRWLPLSWRTRS